MTDRIYGYTMADEPTAEQLDAERETVRNLFAQRPEQRRVTTDDEGRLTTEPAERTPRRAADGQPSHRHQKPHGEGGPSSTERRNRENMRDMFTHEHGTRKMLYFNDDGSTSVEYN